MKVMKKIILLSSLLMAGIIIMKPTQAQFRLNVNIGVQPAWGPAGYDYAEYYYLPDIEAYYSVPERQFIYFDDGRWIQSGYLPDRCRNYDLYNGYKVVINERNPWYHFNDHRSLYAGYRFRHDQGMIRDGREYGAGYGYPQRYDRNEVYSNRGREGRYEREGNYRNENYRRGEYREHERSAYRERGEHRDNGNGRERRGW
jgi:hypothetical protein